MQRVSALVAALAALGGVGCAAPSRTRTFLAVFQSASVERPRPARRTAPHVGPAAMIERALHARGLQFGTDGSVNALYVYMRDRHRAVAPADARPGDVLFFDLGADGLGCPSHVRLVDEADSRARPPGP